ncbi:MAG: hypothetical protein JO199_05475 [Candidatus Eremiobacteraeota bacterium]|nr:hypothetical protein [Candidatus Eremiobacteraeota bacterium]
MTAVAVAACGRQVTPNPPGIGAGGAPVGYMSVKFDVQGTFNFANYQYWVVFNTTGDGTTPGTLPFTNNWAGYSAAIQVSGNAATTFASAGQFVRNSNPAIPPAFVHLITTPQQFQYTANSNGSNTEFTVLFQRQIFKNIGGSTPGPSPSPTASGSPPPFANNWTFNAFVTQANNQNQFQFVNSMGQGGPNNPQFVCCSPPLLINTNFDNVYTALNSGVVTDPAAQILTVELGNNAGGS